MIRHPVLLAGGLLLLLAWAPLPFGSAPPWAASWLQIAGFAVLAGALVTADGAATSVAVRRVAAALGAIAALGLAGSLRWPGAIVAALSPRAAAIQIESARLLGLEAPEAMTLSLAPGASRRAALAWLLAGAVVAAAALLARSRRARRAIAAAILLSAVAQIVYGAQQWIVRATTIWGIEVPNQASRLRGSFVNPNHLATYLVMAVAIASALLWWTARRIPSDARAEERLVRLGPPTLLWLVLVLGLALTGSRAGAAAGVGGVAVQLALLGRERGGRRWLLAGGALAAAGLAFVAWSGFDAGFGRWLGGATAGGSFRIAGLVDALRLWREFPWTGVGLGAFRAAFPLVHPVGDEGTWWHAHGDFVELGATAGPLAVAALAWGAFHLLRGLGAAWRRGRRSEDRAAGLAALGAVAAVGLQETLEFGLTLPANAVTLAAVCGAALAVPLSGRRDPGAEGTSER